MQGRQVALDEPLIDLCIEVCEGVLKTENVCQFGRKRAGNGSG